VPGKLSVTFHPTPGSLPNENYFAWKLSGTFSFKKKNFGVLFNQQFLLVESSFSHVNTSISAVSFEMSQTLESHSTSGSSSCSITGFFKIIFAQRNF
jgi:hypothetical protein